MELTKGQLLQRTVIRLRIHKIHKQKLKRNPATVNRKILPINRAQRNGINVEIEKARSLAENLLDADAHGALGVGEDFNEVSVSQGVVSDIITRGVSKVKKQCCDLRGLVLDACVVCDTEALEADGHGHENHGHGAGGQHEHPAAAEAGDG